MMFKIVAYSPTPFSIKPSNLSYVMPGIVLAGAIGLIGAEYAYQDSKTPTVEKLLIPLLMVGVLGLEFAQIGIVKQLDGLHNFFATLTKNIVQVAIQNEFLDRVESTDAYENNPDVFWLMAVSCIIFTKLAGQYAGKFYIQDKELSKREPLSDYLKAGALGVMVSGGVFEFVREQWSTSSPVKTASLCLVSEVTIPLASVIQAWSILHASHEDFEKVAFARQIITVVAETELNTLSEKGVRLFDSDLSNYLYSVAIILSLKVPGYLLGNVFSRLDEKRSESSTSQRVDMPDLENPNENTPLIPKDKTFATFNLH